MKVIGWSIVLIVAVMMFVNAVYMLTSPRAWFQLPPWIRAEGSLTRGKYSTGWGAVEVRILGAVMLAALGWIIYELFIRQR